MERYLLDTNILSLLMKAAVPALDQRFRRMPNSSLVLSAISEAEVRFGLALLPPEARLHGVAASLLDGMTIAPWDSECARRYAAVAAEQRRIESSLSQADTMIASHALAHDSTLVTHGQAFGRIQGLRVEDWTKGPLPA